MKRAIGVVVAVVLLAFVTVGPDVLACGEKFLVPGRGTQFQRTPADRASSSVLLFAPPASELAKTLARLRVEASIQKAGYRPTLVTSRDGLDKAAIGQRFDLIVIDLADASLFRGRVGAGTGPVVLPVAQKLTGVQLSQARDEFALILKGPTRNQDFLDAIDEGVATSRAAQAKALGSKR
jgi:hypothetical protein